MSKFEIPAEYIEQQVKQALAEDIGSGDVTAQLIPADQRVSATVISRNHAVICGCAWFDQVFRQLDETIKINWRVKDGHKIHENQLLCELYGPTRPLLTGERTALNLLQTLSGTATISRQYADTVAGTQAKVLDTRKTLPGLRLAQKYAVSCGGCQNHRIGLYDMVLIKENHILAAGSIAVAVKRAKKTSPDLVIEIEVENLDQLRLALDAKVDRILLDNMDLETLRKAVRKTAGKTKLEASGGITLETVRDVAETGVDYISVGDITKDLHAVDFSMRFKTK